MLTLYDCQATRLLHYLDRLRSKVNPNKSDDVRARDVVAIKRPAIVAPDSWGVAATPQSHHGNDADAPPPQPPETPQPPAEGASNSTTDVKRGKPTLKVVK